jgi:hypothetical protein
MNKIERIITWEKWEHAVGIENLEQELNDEDEDDIEEGSQKIIRKTQLVTMTPMGPVPVPSYNPDNFNFWLGHTNFDIDHDIGHLVEQVEGVESLDVWTRYRMRVGVGKVFKAGDVMHKIDNAISGYFTDESCQPDQEVKL